MLILLCSNLDFNFICKKGKNLMSSTLVNQPTKKNGGFLKKMKKLDYISPGIHMSFYGKSHYHTWFGVFASMTVYPAIIGLFIYCVFIFDYSSQDIIFTSSEIFPYKTPNEGISLNNSQVNLNFLTYVNDVEYDNDDNPYGRIRMHIYTNMDNLTDTSTDKSLGDKLSTFKDVEVDLYSCGGRDVEWASAKRK